MAEIIEFKVRPAASPIPVDVSGRVSEFMYAFHLLDRAELKTTFYNFDSCWQQGCRTWKVDGVEVNQEDFEEHLTEWLRERAQRRFQPAGTVLPMVIQRVSGR